jgi:TatD DNase family protein
MDYAYTYEDPNRLYLNVTNRCTNRCAFCLRDHLDGLGGFSLHGGREPSLEDLVAAVRALGGPERFRDVVWCGFGEPTYRLDLIVGAASFLHDAGCRVRLNTNGHACLIHDRDVLPELAGAVDEVSVSLNAPNRERYLELSRPISGPEAGEARFWEAVLDFLARAPRHIAGVQASVVGFTLTAVEIEEARALAASLGVTRFRVR